MNIYEFYYIIIPYVNDDIFLSHCSFVSNNKLLSTRRKQILKRKCCSSLNVKVHNFDFYDFEYKLLDGKLKSTIKWMRLFVKHLFLNTIYNHGYCTMQFKKEKRGGSERSA